MSEQQLSRKSDVTRFVPGAYIDDGSHLYEILRLCEDPNYGLGASPIRHVIVEDFYTGLVSGMLLATAENRFRLRAAA